MCKSYNFDIYISGIPVFFDEKPENEDAAI